MHTLVIIFIFQVKQTQVMESNTEIDIRYLNGLSKIKTIKHQIGESCERKITIRELIKEKKTLHLNAWNHGNLFRKTGV